MPAMDFQAMLPGKPPAYLVSPQQYGEFLVQLFDEWYEGGIPRISIRTFDNFLQSYIGVPNELCVHRDSCDSGLVVEYNGDAYPCDFYIHPQWKLGNIFQQSIREMAESQERRAFIGQKHPFPEECQTCEWKNLCHSGCVRNRFIREDGSPTPEYFCQSYKRFFSYADGKLRSLSQRIINRQRYLGQLSIISREHRPMPGRNAPCPCGSGQKHNLCCGTPELSGSYLFQPDSNNAD